MATQAHAAPSTKTAYDFSFTRIDGEPMPLSAYQGKVLLVVNTASECGFTKQYEGLEELYQQFKDEGLVVIGVPSNDFGGQEPGTNAEIKEFCESKFRITFPLTAKEVVSGEEAAPFYLWAAEVLGEDNAPSWNFHKYLVGRDGKLIDYYSAMTKPTSETLISAVEKALAAKP
ncbi:MAG: glutathione peroxidase [Alphaproteobacteria bacterium]